MGKVPFWAPQDGQYNRKAVDESLWSKVKVAGIMLPGICVLTGEMGNKVDTVPVPGSDGDTMTHLGYDPAQVEVTIQLWTKDQLALYIKLVKEHLRPRQLGASKEPRPVTVEHPALEIFSIRALYLMRITLPSPSGEPGVFESKLTFTEYFRKVEHHQKKSKAKKVDGAPVGGNASIIGLPTAIKPSAAPPKP